MMAELMGQFFLNSTRRTPVVTTELFKIQGEEIQFFILQTPMSSPRFSAGGLDGSFANGTWSDSTEPTPEFLITNSAVPSSALHLWSWLEDAQGLPAAQPAT